METLSQSDFLNLKRGEQKEKAKKLRYKRPIVVSNIQDMIALRNSLDPQLRVGFVPTMGALHNGHCQLLKRSIQESDLTICSIFVNPAQFAPGEDFEQYPRTLERDLDKLSELGAEIVFTPNEKMMYPQGFRSYVAPQGADDLSEGSCRPGFFRGVATIVLKLLNIVRPTKLYLGQKDAMQCSILRRMIEDFHLPTETVICPIEREADGLALSSRNVYLSPQEREAAPVIYKALTAAKDLVRDRISSKNSESTDTSRMINDEDTVVIVPCNEIRDIVNRILSSENLIKKIDYVSVADWNNMEELAELRVGGNKQTLVYRDQHLSEKEGSTEAVKNDNKVEKFVSVEYPRSAEEKSDVEEKGVRGHVVISVAAKLASVRLIDNIVL